MSENQLPYWLATLYLEKINPFFIFQTLTHFQTIQSLFDASPEELQHIGFSLPQITQLKNPKWHLVEKDLRWKEAANHHILTLDDPNYPPLLKAISDPPLILYVRGQANLLTQPQIAIIGSRSASENGLHNARQFAVALAEHGFVITSGLARGIDGESHRGALSAKGRTIGVAGTGLHHIYPRTHQKLYEAILQANGAIVSELPLNTPAYAFNFPRRNRIISGLSMGILVIEAALKSGSLITARHALEQGREVFAIPGSIHLPHARGCHRLIREGAKLVETKDHIIEELNMYIDKEKKPTPVQNILVLANLDPEARLLLAQIECEITPYDVILLRSRLTAGKVSSILLTLELNGYIQSVAGGYRRRFEF